LRGHPGEGVHVGARHRAQGLAQAAGAGGKTWHAYLSTQGASAVNAKDRIGKGPWLNAKGVTIAGVSVGGMSEAAARAKIQRELIAPLNKPVIVRSGSR